VKNLILVIGRSGAGKDTLVRYAQGEFGAKSIPSYTDRPIRPTETDGVEHTFLTKEQFDDLLTKEHVFAYTQIGETGYRYCTTLEMLKGIASDTVFYVIDPAGYDFCEKYRDEFNMKVIYVCASSVLRESRANSRNGDSTSWLKRCADEDTEFTDFEKRMPWDALVENDGDVEEAQKRFVTIVKSMLELK
jgi:guanylate kinase